MQHIPVSRRALLGIATVAMATKSVQGSQTPVPEPFAELIIDMTGGPDYLDPALARSTRDWSVVHSVYDSLVHLSDSGSIVPLAAESLSQIDDLTLEVRLRSGLTFHDGSPVTSAAIRRGIEWVQQSEGPAVGNFSIISGVEELDDLTARVITSEPAAWLPSQLAVWHVLIPESFSLEQAQTQPLGSGPYRFVSGAASSEIVLERNADYTWNSPKGFPIADRVVFRFVPESVTRIADLATGAAHIIQSVPVDQHAPIHAAGAEVLETPILGLTMLRISTDVAPFDSNEVRLALNHAIDVETIAQSLVSSQAHRIATLMPDARGIGFNPDVQPFTYDPERARALLAAAGYAEGFSTELQFVSGERDEVMDAFIEQLGAIGVDVTPVSSDLATFNSQWKDPEAPPLRFVSWRPVFDPHTLLSLLFHSGGPLSRYNMPEVDSLISRAAETTDPDARAAMYRELALFLHEHPAAVYLWNLTASYGVAGEAAHWSPRADEYVIPTGGAM